jgi:3-oxoacyl-[acyl-carrier-protein] synthase-3
MITRHGNRAESLHGSVGGIVTAVPSVELTNADLGADAAQAAKMTGVLARRHAAEDQTTETLGLAAARRLLEQMEWAPSSIDLLVYVTQTPGLAVPASAYDLHGRLGLPQHTPAIEVNWSCAGYVYGLWLAMRMLGGTGRALLVVGDTTSRIVHPNDRATAPLFGDACSATAVVAGPERGLTQFVHGTDARGTEKLTMPATREDFVRMDGAAVFSFTLRTVPPLVEDILDIAPAPDYLLFHQANAYMLQHLVGKMKLAERFEPHQIPTNIDRFGNCSSASIPLLLCDKLGNAARVSRLALFGFGAGWSWAGAVLSGYRMQVTELIEV